MNNPQPYVTSPMLTNNEASLLFALHSRTVRGIAENFPYLYRDGASSLCPLCNVCGDSQEHILQCVVLGPTPAKVEYSHIRGNLVEQKKVTEEIIRRLQIRDNILKDEGVVCLPVACNRSRAP